MNDLLFRRQNALGRVRSGVATAEVLGTTTLFIDGVVHRAGYDVRALLGVLGE